MNDLTQDIVDRAVEWSLKQVGSGSYFLRCLAFVEDAYEVPNGIEIFGGSTARESAELYDADTRLDEPPRGAFVFFDTSGPVDGARRDWGHVGLALGDGRIAHAWPEIRLDAITDVPSMPSGGWSPPRYLGWAPAEIILRDARRRTAGAEQTGPVPIRTSAPGEFARVARGSLSSSSGAAGPRPDRGSGRGWTDLRAGAVGG
jgi:cell wall-associated NlpC family hydrolase